MSTVNTSVEEAFIFTQEFGKNPNFTVKTPNTKWSAVSGPLAVLHCFQHCLQK